MKDGPRSLSGSLSSDRFDIASKQLSKHFAIACVFVLIAWHYPRHLIRTEKHIINRTPPYQQTQAGDIILDFTLLNPVTDPATIPCRYKLKIRKNHLRPYLLVLITSPDILILILNNYFRLFTSKTFDVDLGLGTSPYPSGTFFYSQQISTEADTRDNRPRWVCHCYRACRRYYSTTQTMDPTPKTKLLQPVRIRPSFVKVHRRHRKHTGG